MSSVLHIFSFIILISVDWQGQMRLTTLTGSSLPSCGWTQGLAAGTGGALAAPEGGVHPAVPTCIHQAELHHQFGNSCSTLQLAMWSIYCDISSLGGVFKLSGTACSEGWRWADRLRSHQGWLPFIRSRTLVRAGRAVSRWGLRCVKLHASVKLHAPWMWIL